VLVGFAVETGDLVAYAREKLARKGCDLVVANLAEDGFEGDDNRVATLVSAEGAVFPLGTHEQNGPWPGASWDAVRPRWGALDP
jgi:hypothetical protein